ncbi:MAG TPA: PhzF family phenazine biosynthesis protein [Myxococcaceae bacterium]|nr:PhzF family phenazine biosynthesis protein [Myxococcaceae bacterium]
MEKADLTVSRFEYVTADVFTDRPFGGNPLAVFPDARGLPEALMQQVARELNLSETVFVLPPERPEHSRRLRIFTPAAELPFAGHPTVGTAAVLADIGVLGTPTDGPIEIVLEEKVGPVAVRVERRAGAPTAAVLTAPRRPERGPLSIDRPQIAKVLGLPAAALAEAPWAPAAYSAGVAFLFIPVRDAPALASATVDVGTWRDALANSWAPELYVLTMEDWQRGREIRARMFAPRMGNVEDPATGAAAAALPGFLASNQTLPDGRAQWTIRQGEEMGRASRIALEADIAAGRPTAVRVGGSSVMMSRGTLMLPRDWTSRNGSAG